MFLVPLGRVKSAAVRGWGREARKDPSSFIPHPLARSASPSWNRRQLWVSKTMSPGPRIETTSSTGLGRSPTECPRARQSPSVTVAHLYEALTMLTLQKGSELS